MRLATTSSRVIIILLLVFLLAASAASEAEENDDITVPVPNKKSGDDEKHDNSESTAPAAAAAATTNTDHNSDSTIEMNPDYESDDGGDDDDESDGYDSDEEEEEDKDDEESKQATKSALDKALATSRKIPRKTLGFAKKHRVKITVALTLLAFRREIYGFLVDKIAPTIGVDPETGKVVRKFTRLDLTAALKIIVFIDIMRQMQAAGKKRDPLIVFFLLLVAKNPVLTSFITKAILQENNSYVPPIEQHYTFERLNDRYKKDCLALQKAVNHKPNLTEISLVSLLHRDRDDKAESETFPETVIILDLIGIDSGRIDTLRDEVSFLLHLHRQNIIPGANTTTTTTTTTSLREPKHFEILVLLESPGGSASDFALASQQLLRLRKEPGIQVTVCVDKVAASGGYMIACASSPGRLFAAPFAVLGSIGVIGQTVNVQKVLEGWGVRPYVFRAGNEKAPLGLIGDVSSKDMKTIQSMVDETHRAFKGHVAYARPCLAERIEDLATGRIWLGCDALRVKLIDRLITSDEYIWERNKSGARLLKLIQNKRKRSLFGGHQTRIGIESRIHSSVIAPFMEYTKRALLKLAEKIDLPLDGVTDSVPLSSKVGFGTVLASPEAAMYATSSPKI